MAKASRHNARRAAVQALYQWDMTQQAAHHIEDNFIPGPALENADEAYFKELITEVPAKTEELDGHIAGTISRPLKEVDPIERNILRLGVYSFLYEPSVPWKVVVNECIELTRVFGTDQGYRFVNGVLDKLAATLRSEERAKGDSA